MIKVINALFVMAIAAPAIGNVVHECFNPGSDIGAPHIVDKIPDQSIGLTLTSATGPTKRLRKSVSFNIVEHTQFGHVFELKWLNKSTVATKRPQILVEFLH